MRSQLIARQTWLGCTAGPSNPGCNAGMSFTALRDDAQMLPGESASRCCVERLNELAGAAANLAESGDARAVNELARDRRPHGAQDARIRAGARCRRGTGRIDGKSLPGSGAQQLQQAWSP